MRLSARSAAGHFLLVRFHIRSLLRLGTGEALAVRRLRHLFLLGSRLPVELVILSCHTESVVVSCLRHSFVLHLFAGLVGQVSEVFHACLCFA